MQIAYHLSYVNLVNIKKIYIHVNVNTILHESGEIFQTLCYLAFWIEGNNADLRILAFWICRLPLLQFSPALRDVCLDIQYP